MKNLFRKKPLIKEEVPPEIPKEMQNARDYFNRGMVYYGQQQYEAAFADFQQALQMDGDNYDAHYGIGLVHKALSRDTEAREAFEQVLRLVEQLPSDVDPNRVAMLKRITQSQLDNLKEFLH